MGELRMIGRLSFMSRGIFLVFSLLAVVCVQARAADIRVEVGSDPKDQVPVVIVDGDFLEGDEKKFTQVALANDMAIIVLNSYGGSTLAGIEIGKVIRLKGYWTYVPAEAVCASACSYAWLGGIQRYLEPGGKIGFHASYVQENGINKESGVGNAIVGAYLNSLGLSQYAIAYISTAPPESMTWMTIEDAQSVGIEFKVVDANGETDKARNEQMASSKDDTIVVAPLDPPSGQTQQTVPQPPVAVPPQPQSPIGSSERAMTHINGADIFGHDLPGMPLKNVTKYQCEEACVADARCRAFTFNKRHDVCFLKSSGERVFRNPNAEAGYMRDLQSSLRRSSMTIMERTDFPGNDYDELRDVGFGECSDVCEEDDRCRAFTYMAKRKRCWLKDDLSDPETSKLTISGVKD